MQVVNRPPLHFSIKMEKTYKQDKGQAGLSIMLSVIVLLFIIGLIVMIFSLMGAELQTSSYTTTTATSTNESLAQPTTAGITLTVGNTAIGSRAGSCGTITNVWNGTIGATGTAIGLGNFTQTGCTVVNTTLLGETYTANLRFTYPYTYEANNSATDVMFDTVDGIAGTTDWFDIFIVITAMIVLILLVVIIITAIRGSGLIAGGEQRGANQVGTA